MADLREHAVTTDGCLADPPLATAHVPIDTPDPLRRLAARLGPGPFALVVLFVTPQADVARLARETGLAFPGVPVIGCTTAG